MNGETVGAALNRLRRRAGMSLEGVARGAKYAGPSSVQVYFNAEFDGPLSVKVATRLAKAMTGRGEPPVSEDEVFGLVHAKVGLRLAREAPADDLLGAANRIAEALERIADLLARPRGVL